MPLARRLQRRIGWAALLALLLATLAPSIAHAVRHARGDALPWSQLCSATGGKRVMFEAPAGEPGSAAPAHAFERCALCALGADAWAPPPASGRHALRADLRVVVPHAQQLSPRPRLAWLAARPRAPPH